MSILALEGVGGMVVVLGKEGKTKRENIYVES